MSPTRKKTMKKWLARVPGTVDQLVVQPLQEFVKDITGSHDEGSDDSEDETTNTSEDVVNNNVVVELSLRGGAELLLNSPRFAGENHSRKQKYGYALKSKQTLQQPERRHPIIEQEMILKLLRGVSFPTESFQLNIYQSNGTCAYKDKMHLVGTVREDGDVNSPSIIWGGSSNRWSLRGNQHDNLVFQLSIIHQGVSSSTSGWSIDIHTCTRKVSELLSNANQHPNVWIRFDAQSEAAEIQIRLSLEQNASPDVHPQENCPLLSPGPGLPAPFTSYRIRKEALWSCCPVMLNVYDVSTNANVETINQYTKAVGAGGIFHAAIQVHGKEYSFGGTLNKRSTVTGIMSCPPKECPMHHYRESIYLGDCELGPDQIDAILADLKPHWQARSYNLFRKNCCFFCRELAIELGVGDIPAWVYSLATSAEFIEPYAIQLNQYLIERALAKKNATKQDAVTTTSTPSRERGSVIHRANKIESGPAKEEPHQDFLDHAMAVRIQRNFRRK